MLIVAQSEADVNAYLQQYLYKPLEDAFPLSGFSSHRIKQKTAVFDMKGEPDFAATAIDLAGQERLLFAAETTTVMSFPVPYGTTTAEAWQDLERRSSITKAVGQAFGYLLSNDLIYGLLTSGERFVFIQRKGRSIQVADVYRTSREPTPMAAIIYLMQRWVVPMCPLRSQSRCLPEQPICMLQVASNRISATKGDLSN